MAGGPGLWQSVGAKLQRQGKAVFQLQQDLLPAGSDLQVDGALISGLLEAGKDRIFNEIREQNSKIIFLSG